MHPDTATSLNNLADLYDSQGKYDDAEPLYKRALAVKEEVLGPMHPDTATSLNNLADLYESQGKYDDAEPLYKRALAVREEVLGPMHPDTATSLNNLADLYTTRANTMTRSRSTNGHWRLGGSIGTHASCHGDVAEQPGASLHNQGKYDDAEPLYKRALAVREEVLGPMHPDTATSLNNLAHLYDSQGKYDDAEPLLKRALTIYEEKLGPTHPNTVDARKTINIICSREQELELSREQFRRAM